ncbi:MAG TPA: ABC transporter ATP-binding protein, partial [bacterium]|nr:ABC transporter ATP-binding protein [bacterium]
MRADGGRIHTDRSSCAGTSPALHNISYQNMSHAREDSDRRPVRWSEAFAIASLAGHRPLLLLASLAVLQAVLPLIGLLAMKELVDAVAAGVAKRIPADQAGARALWATGFAAGTALFGAVLQSVLSLLQEHHGRRLGDLSLARLERHTARLPLRRFDEPGFHDLLQRAGSEAGQRPVRLVQDLTALLVAFCSLGLMAFVLARIEPWLPVLVGLAAVPTAWARRRHAGKRFAWHRDHVVEQRQVGYLGAVLTGRATAKDVRVLALATPLAERLRALRQRLRRSLFVLARQRARDELLVAALAAGALFGAYVYLSFAAFAGVMTLGGLVLHAQAAQRTQNAVRDLLAAAAGVHEHRLFLRPLRQFLDLPAATPVIRTKEREPASVRARALVFAYPGAARPVFDGLDLDVQAGERIAVVGANGCGKSTLIKLLLGLYAPDRGELVVRSGPIAALLQDAAAFERTLRENLQLGQS